MPLPPLPAGAQELPPLPPGAQELSGTQQAAPHTWADDAADAAQAAYEFSFKPAVDFLSPIWDWQHGAERQGQVIRGFDPVAGYRRINREANAAASALMRGDVRGLAYHAAGSVPFLGEPAQQIGQEAGKGEYAKGFGHAVGLIGSALVGAKALGAVEALPEAVDVAGTATRGAVSGGAKAFGRGLVDPNTGNLAVLGGLATRGPKGAALALVPPTVKGIAGAYQGAKAALAARAASLRPVPQIEAPAPLPPLPRTGQEGLQPTVVPGGVQPTGLGGYAARSWPPLPEEPPPPAGLSIQALRAPGARVPGATPIGTGGYSSQSWPAEPAGAPPEPPPSITIAPPRQGPTGPPGYTPPVTGGPSWNTWSATPAEVAEAAPAEVAPAGAALVTLDQVAQGAGYRSFAAVKDPTTRAQILATTKAINQDIVAKAKAVKPAEPEPEPEPQPQPEKPAAEAAPPEEAPPQYISPESWEKSFFKWKDKNNKFHARGEELDVPAIRTRDGRVLAPSPAGQRLTSGTLRALTDAMYPDTAPGDMSPVQFDSVLKFLEQLGSAPGEQKARGGAIGQLSRRAYDRSTQLRALAS